MFGERGDFDFINNNLVRKQSAVSRKIASRVVLRYWRPKELLTDTRSYRFKFCVVGFFERLTPTYQQLRPLINLRRTASAHISSVRGIIFELPSVNWKRLRRRSSRVCNNVPIEISPNFDWLRNDLHTNQDFLYRFLVHRDQLTQHRHRKTVDVIRASC